jgi:AraC family transcriptional regulator of adaptative response/methylated-DNA-[protein]-cysteine methyltransferase
MGKKLTLGRALDDGQWALMLARAPVGYIYAVTTTGICCRPGCPARTPNRQNVSLFDSRSQAEAAGFRACKRCWKP